MATQRQQALPAGTRIDGFEIRRVIGTGGFGVTYLGFDTSLERAVAIKEYCPQGVAVRTPGDTTLVPGDPECEAAFTYGLTRFLDEARTLARFHHPSIVRVQRFLEANGTGYLVMDFEQGRTLWDALRHEIRIDEDSLLALLVPVLEGLSVVHAQSFLHRDIKPANIFLRDNGVPVLLDFGAARLSMKQQEGAMTVLLTPGYAPLEQYSGTDQQGPWSDIYALGATAFHCMTGAAPTTATERVTRLHTGEPDPVVAVLERNPGAYSNLLRETVLWMLEPAASHRPQSTQALLDALRPATTGGPATTSPPTVVADFEPTPQLTKLLRTTLEKHAGAVAQRVVAPAVARATRYEDLVEHLAGFVLDPQHQMRFRDEATRLRADTMRLRDAAPREDHGATGGGRTTGVTDEVLERAAEQLADFVGPIAAVLVEQAAGEARSKADLYALLAAEIEDADERREFLARLK